MKLVIDRTKWLRGEGNSQSRLLRSGDGKMCCMGFYSLACGLKDDEIRDSPWPDHSESRVPDWIHGKGLSRLNDSEDIPDALREQRISKIFAKHGVEVEFVS